MSEKKLAATHQCIRCGARWRQCDDFTWSLRSERCGPCCDNVAMGEQIEALQDVALWAGPLTAEEEAMIDSAWDNHEAARPTAPALVEAGEVTHSVPPAFAQGFLE